MSVPYPIPVTATQVGSYFVGQYYKVMEQQPEYAYQFYSDASTMLRVQGSSSWSASGLLQIHALIMSLKYTAFEVRTAHALESWSGGVIVMVSGFVRIQDSVRRRQFVETFFLAPQEKGYFVLNNVSHFIEDVYLHHPGIVPEPGDVQSGQDAKDNGRSENANFPVWEVNIARESHDHHLEDSAAEPVKHTYASVLRTARSQLSSSVTPAKEDLNVHHQETFRIEELESPGVDATDEALFAEDDDEIRSVYVRNLLPDASEPEIEEEFKKFGKIAPDGVVIRSRKDLGVCYAFVEFEDMAGVNNAVKAGNATVGGRQVYIEERRANSNIPSRLARRGRGRGRTSGRTLGYKENGNGYFRPTSRGNHATRSAQEDSF